MTPTYTAAQALPAASRANETRPVERFYHPELDGLRFVAFLAVFFFHLFPLEPTQVGNPISREIVNWLCSLQRTGAAGVDLFFVLSSYLITQLLLREQQSSGSIDIRSFYVRRILRIWPLYYAMLLFAWAGEHWLFGEGGMPGDYAVWYALFVGNWAIGWFGHHPPSAAMVLWTVSIEEQFYLAWPWLVRWLNPRRLFALAVGLLICASAIRIALVALQAPMDVIQFNTFTRMDGIAAGALLALVLGPRTATLTRATRATICIATFVAIVIMMRVCVQSDPHVAYLFIYPVWTAAATLIVWAALQPVGQAVGVLTWRPVVYLGRISYGLYVLHYLCIGLAMTLWIKFLPGVPLTRPRLIVALPLTILLATLSYYLLERPFLRLKLRFTHVASRPGG